MKMEIPSNKWYSAISIRKSQRSYDGKPISREHMSRIQEVCKAFHPFEGVRCEFIQEPAEDVFKGVVGNYGRVTNSPHYVAIISESNQPEIQAASGYIGEGVVLEATSLGLGTCWIGGMFRESKAREQNELSGQEFISALIPIGNAIDNRTIGQKLITSFIGSHHRKEIEDLIEGKLEDAKPWMQTALYAARLAPSARNRQPWRFRIEEDSIVVKYKKARDDFWISTALDCGISMLHLELGARFDGMKCSWQWLEAPEIARLVSEKND